MNRPYDDDDGPPGRGYSRDPGRSDSGRSDLGHSADREISLGAPAILGIFFALVLVCAGFFGFGYTMGRKSAQSANADTVAANASDATSSNGSAKPAAGSLASPPAAQPAADSSAAPVVVQPEPASGASATQPTPSKNAATAADGMIVGDKPPPSNPQPAATNQPPAISPSGTIMVQIAAVSSQDVADILLASLRKKGYSVSVRHEPQDKLLHIQIGPFANRKDAEAMQQRILADGFNAIVK